MEYSTNDTVYVSNLSKLCEIHSLIKKLEPYGKIINAAKFYK